MKYDSVISAVGGFGKYQKLFYLLTFMTTLPNGFIMLMFVFIHYLPKHRCKIPQLENTTGIEKELLLNLTIPWVYNEEGILERSECETFNFNPESLSLHKDLTTTIEIDHDNLTKCLNGWHYESTPEFESAVTEFNLVCGDAWKVPLAVSAYMIGMAVGAYSGIISDKFGRRTVFLWATFLCFGFNGLTGFAWNYLTYTICMFFNGLMSLVNFMVAFIMASEIMDVEHRNMMALGPFLAFALGYMISPILGYLLQNWRWYMWANGLLGIVYIPYYWLMPESPRWLITKGKLAEAKKLLRKIAEVNGKKVNMDKIFQEGIELDGGEETKTLANEEASVLYVFSSRTLRIRVAVCLFDWFVTCLVYYVIALNSSNFSGDRFVNSFLSAAIEMPSYIFSWFLLKKFGVPRTIFAFMGISGLFCLAVPLLQMSRMNTLIKVSALLGKGAVSVVFYADYVCAINISPTLVRNFSAGLASAFARLGGIAAPYLIFAGETLHPTLPFITMVILSFASAFLSIVYIPETKGIPLPDSKAEAVANQRYYGPKFWKPAVDKTSRAKDVAEEKI